jgi:hypothetical protein
MYSLLPQPRFCREGGEDFPVRKNLCIVLNARCTEEDFFAAEQLQDAVRAMSGLTLVVEKSEGIDQGPAKTLRLLTIAGILANVCIFEKAGPLAREYGDEGYELTVDGTAVLKAHGSAGLFYGVQTLKQLLYKDRRNNLFLKSARIKDWPDFRYRGVMLDVSRGQVPTIPALKEMIGLYSSLKINFLNLYIEHSFKFKKHPQIGKNLGRYSPAEIRDLDAFAKKHFVELAGSFQSFGHQAHILKLPQYAALAETKEAWDLTPARPETYALLKDVYDEIAPVFSSRLFNINSDETFTLGEGQSRGMVQQSGKAQVYLGHIKKLKAMLDKHDKRTMMWADIVLEHPETLRDIPRDIIMLVWGYGEPIAKETMQKVKKAGFEFMACPGTNADFKLIPENRTTRRAQAGTIRHAHQARALGILCTEWGTQFSHDNLFGWNVFGFAHSADLSWAVQNSAGAGAQSFLDRFSRVIFGDESGSSGRELEKFGELNRVFEQHARRHMRNVSIFEWYNINHNLYHESGFPGHLVSQATPDLIASFIKKTKAVEAGMIAADRSVTKNRRIWEEFMFSLDMHKYLARKLTILAALIARPESKNPRMRAALSGLRKEITRLKDRHAALWLKTSKREGLPYLLKRYDWQSETYAKLMTKS